MFNLRNSKVSDEDIIKMSKQNNSTIEKDMTFQKINNILTRKDVIDLDNHKVDTLRMLLYHLENKKEMSISRLIKFLKL